jgi:hypothetical protein
VGRISPVGAIGSETIVNDFILIRFTEAASAQNSARLKLSASNQDTSRSIASANASTPKDLSGHATSMHQFRALTT